jgi:ribosomal protein S12 methylthiotransferase
VDNEVIISSDKEYIRQGDFTHVKITEATEFDLMGTPAVAGK